MQFLKKRFLPFGFNVEKRGQSYSLTWETCWGACGRFCWETDER